MKEFYKWRQKCEESREYICYGDDGGRELCVDLAIEGAWKAALEWALTHKKPIKYNDYKFDYIKTDVIEEELNAKT